MRKWVVAGIGAMAAMGSAGLFGGYGYKRQMRDLHGRLAEGSRVADTAYGPIEYASVGEGPAVLIAHGIGGGYDQGMLVTRLTKDNPFRLISVSRFGYLRTPLGRYSTPEEQADAYAALLDALGIEKAAMVGVSAAGPSSLLFALRHPDRCWGLVMVSGVSQRLVPNLTSRELFFVELMNRDLSLWLFSNAAEKKLFDLYGVTEGVRAGIANQPEKLEVLRSIFFPLPVSARRIGFNNDMKQFPNIPVYPLERITVPTLVLHGTADSVVPLSHARFVAERVPNAQLLAVEGGGHLCIVTHKEEALPRVMDFLMRNAE